MIAITRTQRNKSEIGLSRMIKYSLTKVDNRLCKFPVTLRHLKKATLTINPLDIWINYLDPLDNWISLEEDRLYLQMVCLELGFKYYYLLKNLACE